MEFPRDYPKLSLKKYPTYSKVICSMLHVVIKGFNPERGKKMLPLKWKCQTMIRKVKEWTQY